MNRLKIILRESKKRFGPDLGFCIKRFAPPILQMSLEENENGPKPTWQIRSNRETSKAIRSAPPLTFSSFTGVSLGRKLPNNKNPESSKTRQEGFG
jgi:hypothetical protein